MGFGDHHLMHYFMSFIISGHMSYPSVSNLKSAWSVPTNVPTNISANEKAPVTTDLQNVCFLTSFCHGSLIITEKPMCRKYKSFTLPVVHFI